MTSTSSARKPLALLLCLAMAMQGTAASAAAAVPLPESCLLLKYIAPSVPESFARERMANIPSLLSKELGVRWVPLPAPEAASRDPKSLFSEADDASIERISGKIAEALRRMDRMETREAKALLAEAEGEARKFRLGEATRPLFAEIFLRRGLLYLWEGSPGKGEEMFARSRALRPGFSPDPGLFSPTIREAWSKAAKRQAPGADLLVHTIPPGASVYLDGKHAGNTPVRIRVASHGPVRVRMVLAGYQDMEKAGQWLPGDSEAVEIVMIRDRAATLGELLTASPDGRGSGPLIAELAAAAGASRVALLVLSGTEGKPVARVLTSGKGDSDPVVLGEFAWPSEGAEEAADMTARLLLGAGWPAAGGSRGGTESAWYHKWWVWLLIGAAAVGVAAGAGGGGDGGGGSTGTIGVTF